MIGLTEELASLFVKATYDKPEPKKETIAYGTAVTQNGKLHVRLDGSDILTPVESTADAKPGDRVTVMIKNHTATITGNLTSPSARSEDVQEISENVASKISEFEIAIAYRVKTEELEATNAIIDSLRTKLANVNKLESVEAEIETLQSDYAHLDYVLAKDVEALNAEIENLEIVFGTFLDISTEDLEALNAELTNLKSYNAEFTYVSATLMQALKASVTELDTKKLSTEQADIRYANIDFSNIGQAAMEYFYSQSGLIENVTIGDGTLTGRLVGVTIQGDLIEANTLVADKIVMLGDDGLYYKLNTDGVTTGAEQTEYNSLNGQIILAKSITAEKVSVSDLVAFDATIGGFNITETSIFSEVKDSEGNTTRGIHLDADGEFNFGDETNYIRYFRDDAGNYHLAISADTVMYDVNGNQYSLGDLGIIGDYVKIGVYEEEPCIELGETDSDLKILITNTKIVFLEGSGELAYFSNQSLYVKRIVVEEELQQGKFMWKVRENGNLGLMWVGGD